MKFKITKIIYNKNNNKLIMILKFINLSQK